MYYNKFLEYLLLKYKLNKILDCNNEKLIYEIIFDALDINIQFVNDNILQLIYDDLYEESFNYSYNILYTNYIENKVLENTLSSSSNNILNNKYSEKKCIKIIERCCNIANCLVYKYFIPQRSYKQSYIRKNNENKSYNLDIHKIKIQKQINILKEIIQPEQRTNEWYLFRNSTLTASNIYKIFISDYTQTQLILEKCEPIDINKYKVTNTNSPLHWGQKYEPVSILYYEYINNTKVDEFGCIPHKDYSFIAASPDGIICDASSELFGRMLEIKNVVSREISGIPKMEYWIQMQLQMEVCNLNECDFLETKFTEYSDIDDYKCDTDFKYKGTFLQFYKDETPYYVYPPFTLNDVDCEKYILWHNEQLKINKDKEFITTIYWKLEVISCILVLRNKHWFANVLPMIEIFWNNLVEERESGQYKERIKKKRKLQIDDAKSKSDFPSGGCLINI
tara:strand:- start:2327 stop:3679 length:1353 start_codon:yes stop_codon:yes gene_type:complete